MSDSEFSDDYIKLLLDRAHSLFPDKTVSEIPEVPKPKKQSALDLKREQVRLKLLEARSKPKPSPKKDPKIIDQEEYASIKQKMTNSKSVVSTEVYPKKKREPVRIYNAVPQQSDSESSENEFDQLILSSNQTEKKSIPKSIEKPLQKVVPSSIPELPKKNKLFSPYHSFASKNGFLN